MTKNTSISSISVSIVPRLGDGWFCSLQCDDTIRVWVLKDMKADLNTHATRQEIRDFVVSEAWRNGVEIESDDVTLDHDTCPTHAYWDAPE